MAINRDSFLELGHYSLGNSVPNLVGRAQWFVPVEIRGGNGASSIALCHFLVLVKQQGEAKSVAECQARGQDEAFAISDDGP
jgi:hypothetical protein